MNEARLILTCGLPGAGKTELAKRLAAVRGAVRLTKDEWLWASAPLLGTSRPGRGSNANSGALPKTSCTFGIVAQSPIVDAIQAERFPASFSGCWSLFKYALAACQWHGVTGCPVRRDEAQLIWNV